MECDAVFKGTKVDGIYDKDPVKFPEAKRFDEISYDEVINRNITLMDPTAFTLARDIKMPLIVFKIIEKDSILKVVKGEGKYTIVN